MTGVTSGTPALPAPARRSYIDWLRGLAVLFMVLWHSIDAWHVSTDRGTAAFGVIGFLAGWAAPMFLFLAGVSLPMAGRSRMARGVSRASASGLLVRRGFQVFLIAHLFRMQSWVLNPNAAWDALFKPDILNVLGLGMMAAGAAWRYATSLRAAACCFLLPAVVVTGVLVPWIPAWAWPSLLHPRLEGYLRVVNGNAVFSLFPAVAYVFVGAFIGHVLVTGRWTERAVHAYGGAVGAALVLMAETLTRIPVPAQIAHWTIPTIVVGGRIGAMFLMMWGAWFVLHRRAPGRASPFMVFGQTSLFVYFVHIELVYGRITYPIHHSLSLPAAITAYVLLTLGLYAASRLWLRRPVGAPLIPTHLVSESRVKA